ncbi:hypothetical protein [Terrisporobacter petrolearius]|uniref:hypothetical protein n=1 Tax=Terrisporobacter petrolearius TaxID=1460447 RepID=UPI003B00F531
MGTTRYSKGGFKYYTCNKDIQGSTICVVGEDGTSPVFNKRGIFMEWILSMSITQIIIGVILIIIYKISKNNNSINMIKIIGYINIFLGGITLTIQKLNDKLSIITMLIFSISIIITFIYISVILLKTINDRAKKN